MCQSMPLARAGLSALALLTAALAFAAPAACGQALQQTLALCGGPLLLSLYPFLIVSSLLVRCGAVQSLGLPLRPLALLIGVRAPCAGGILLAGALGGFAPAARAAAESYQAGELPAEEAAALLPACVCAGPSFVVLTVGGQMLGSTGYGVRLYAAQLLAGYISAALLCRARRRSAARRQSKPPPFAQQSRPAASGAAPAPPQLHAVIAQAALSYIQLCGFMLYFRFLSAGLAAFLPPRAGLALAMLLEVGSGCAAAAAAGPGRGLLCCAALSWQGVSALLQARALCPPQVSIKPLLVARALHLPLALALLRLFLLLPAGAAEVFSTLPPRVVVMRRVPPDCALLVFLACCVVACRLCRALPGPKDARRQK